MKEALWGYWLIILGIFIIVVLLLVQSFTSTNTQDYYLVKTIAEASMEDAIDWSYYRLYGEVKINKEKFYESFLRRFAEETSLATTYTIEFTEVYEAPPKVGVKVSSKSSTFSIAGDSTTFDIVNKIDAILENRSTSAPVSDDDIDTWNTNPVTPDNPENPENPGDTINAIRYNDCHSYFITTCQETVCNYIQMDGTYKIGTINRTALTVENNPSCTPDEPGDISTVCTDEHVETEESGLTAYAMYKQAHAKNAPNGSDKFVINAGDTVKIVGRKSASDKWFLVEKDNECGYIYQNWLALDLQEYFNKLNINNVMFTITNKTGSIFTADKNLTHIIATDGTDLYGLKLYSSAHKPLGTYPFAKKLAKAIKSTNKTIQIYDTYRPIGAAKKMYTIYKSYFDNPANAGYRNTLKNYTGWRIYSNGSTSNKAKSETWFLAAGVSTHSVGCAADLTIAGAQMPTQIHVLHPDSAGTNSNVTELENIMMRNGGLGTISSEWWHYEDYTECYQAFVNEAGSKANLANYAPNFWSNY